MRIIRIILYSVLILIGITFAALNAGSVKVNLYVTTMTLPVSLLMVIMMGVGLLIGFLIFVARYWQFKLALLKIQSQLKITEKEIKNLRDIPLKNQH